MTPTFKTTTEAIDPVFVFIFGVCLVLLVGITAVMVWFVIRYHRSRAPVPTSAAEGNLWLELVWTLLPTILVLAMFFYGWSGYLSLRNVPKGAFQVTATARMWSWNFSYEGGKTSPKLVVPAGKPIMVDLVSADVIHGFYIPAFRIKRDVVPEMKNHVWFMAEKPGVYDLFCSVYCGTGHSAMITSVEALPEKEFAAWLSAGGGTEKVDGRSILQKRGCVACHSLDGKTGVGPTFKGLFGRQEVVLSAGKERTIVVDKEYVRRSILEPGADVAKGYQPVMPPYRDIPAEEMEEMLRFLEGLK